MNTLLQARTTFEGLALLPLSAAVRTAVLDEPAVGELALLRMSPPARNSILRSLSEADAARILRGIGGPASEPTKRALIACLERIEGGSRVAALRVYLAVREAVPDEAAETVGAAVAAVSAFVHAAARVTNVATLVQAVRRGDVATLIRLTDASVGQSLARLKTVPESALYRAVGLAEPGAPAMQRTTPYGGAFLLLESLAEIPLDDWCADWPSGEIEPAQALRWTLLLQSLGASRSYGASYDPILRDLLMIPPTFELRAWSRLLKDHRLAALQNELERWQGAQGHLSGTCVEAEGIWIDDEQGLYVRGPGDGGEPNEETLARLKYLSSDRKYLRLDPRVGVSRRVADGLAPVAMAVLRSFAWRLPGFGRTHLEHLSRNFLACAAEVVREEDMLHVSLTRPPLDLVLRMTRVARADIAIPWTSPQRLSIHL
ncbi:hypothetical protein EON82_06165 [bacterium]|nr:MAG: hypothetical protein EON82_06165 [bacterium]